MLIDWFTIIAQLINFLILVWLLKRFLYKPILHAIDEREAQIAGKISNAKAIELNAKKESDELQVKIKEIDEQRVTLLAKAATEAETERERLLEEAKKEIAFFIEKRRKDFKREEKDINKRIIQQMQNEVFAITRKVLLDLAGTTLESQIVDAFIQQLSEFNEENNNLIKSLSTPSSSSLKQGVIRSTTELTLKQRGAIEDAISENLKIKSKLQFEIVPDLYSGIEFIMNGQKLAWSIEDYLATLETKVHDFLNPEKLAP
jgi:F-type H+-transporting ATPase subunit b